jgi:hypothetical protein
MRIPEFCKEADITLGEFARALDGGYAPRIRNITLGDRQVTVVCAHSAKRHLDSIRFAVEIAEASV